MHTPLLGIPINPSAGTIAPTVDFDVKSESEFIQACRSGNLAVVSQSLIQDKSLAHKVSTSGSYPLMYAAQRGHVAVVEALVKAGAEIEATKYQGGPTALVFAADNQQWAVVTRLLALGANPNAGIFVGPAQKKTVLSAALYYGNQEAYAQLISRGATLPAFNINTESEFIQACSAGNLETVSRLLTEDPSLANTPATNGSLPLISVAHEMTEALLIRAGAEINAEIRAGASRGVTALLRAVSLQQWPRVNRLLALGARNLDASPVEGPTRGKTALWWAIHYANEETFVQLLSKGASLEIEGNTKVNLKKLGERLALYSTRNSINLSLTFNAAKLLFKLADNDAILLEEQAAEQSKELTRAIFILGSALNGRVNGKTALQVAIEKGNETVIEALVMAGADLFESLNQAAQASALPVAQAFSKLRALNEAVDQFLKRGENLKAKVEAEQPITAILKLKDEILELSQTVESAILRNKLRYELGELLEKVLPNIPQSVIVEVYSQVLNESKSEDLYKKACSKLVHYKIVSSRSSSIKGLDEEMSDEESEKETKETKETAETFMLALRAGDEGDATLLSQTLIRGMLGPIGGGLGLIKPSDTFSEGIAKTFKFLQGEVSSLKHAQGKNSQDKNRAISSLSSSSKDGRAMSLSYSSTPPIRDPGPVTSGLTGKAEKGSEKKEAAESNAYTRILYNLHRSKPNGKKRLRGSGKQEENEGSLQSEALVLEQQAAVVSEEAEHSEGNKKRKGVKGK